MGRDPPPLFSKGPPGRLLAVRARRAGPFAVLEVGLGGRLDAVNLIDADLALITSIGLDHADWLGDTRESVAFEKAGILRAGKPAPVGDLIPRSHCWSRWLR